MEVLTHYPGRGKNYRVFQRPVEADEPLVIGAKGEFLGFFFNRHSAMDRIQEEARSYVDYAIFEKHRLE